MCSRTRGPAIAPSLVTWPTRNIGMFRILASRSSRAVHAIEFLAWYAYPPEVLVPHLRDWRGFAPQPLVPARGKRGRSSGRCARHRLDKGIPTAAIGASPRPLGLLAPALLANEHRAC